MTPTAWVLVVFGVLVMFLLASFTNVVVDRMPLALDEPNEYGELWDTRPWGEVVAGRSRCSSCGAEVRWVDNIPVVSYLLLRGRCRSCGERYGAFHVLVELAVPLTAVLVTWGVVHYQGWSWVLLPYLFLVPVGAALTVIDLRTLILPTRIIWPAAAVMAVLCVAAALLEGHPEWLLGVAMGVVAFAGPLFLIWFVIPTGMGFGDVRLATLLGMVVGLAAASTGRSFGWAALLAVMCMLVSSVLGISLSMAVLPWRRKLPFGPELIVGTLVCAALAQPILDAFG
jgi:leader peptidase (prepilin peptidase) / N-methyltransferase